MKGILTTNGFALVGSARIRADAFAQLPLVMMRKPARPQLVRTADLNWQARSTCRSIASCRAACTVALHLCAFRWAGAPIAPNAQVELAPHQAHECGRWMPEADGTPKEYYTVRGPTSNGGLGKFG